MNYLATLKVIPSKRPPRLSPIQHRRNKLIAKLHEQLECAQARIDGREYVITRLRNVRNSDTGQRLPVEQQYRPKPWWYTNHEGRTIFEVKYGSRVIELSKGKAGIEVENISALPATIELVKKAVEAGELDEGINALAGGFGRQIRK